MPITAALLGGCALVAPTPTPVDVPDGQVWIEWENRTEDSWAISVVAEGEGISDYAEAEPCTAGGMGVVVAEPFSIGIGPWVLGDVGEAPREVADERAWRQAGGRLLLIIEDGPLLGGPTVTLDTWVEQRADVPGFCP